MRNKSARPRVVVVATPGTRVFELGIACEVFGTDRRYLSPDWYDFELVGTADPTVLSNAITCPRGRGLAALRDADTVIVPACTSVHELVPPGLAEALAEAHDRGARVASICSGAFVLAEAGLLDGRTVTTHWMHADELAKRFPRARVDPTALYLHDSGVWTSAGSAAGLDLCLELVRQDFGAAAANEVARRVVTPPHRSGNQAQYVRHPPASQRRGPTDEARIFQWAREHLSEATVMAMAAYAGVSQRTLVRIFQRSTQMSPQAWLQRERLNAAQDLLESTTLPLHAIARRTGLGTPANLRARFAASFGLPPHQYRATFNANAPRTSIADIART